MTPSNWIEIVRVVFIFATWVLLILIFLQLKKIKKKTFECLDTLEKELEALKKKKEALERDNENVKTNTQ